MRIDLEIDLISLLCGIIIGIVLLMCLVAVLNKYIDNDFTDKQLKQLETICRETKEVDR